MHKGKGISTPSGIYQPAPLSAKITSDLIIANKGRIRGVLATSSAVPGRGYGLPLLGKGI